MNRERKIGVQGIQGIQGVQGVQRIQGVHGIHGVQGVQGTAAKTKRALAAAISAIILTTALLLSGCGSSGTNSGNRANNDTGSQTTITADKAAATQQSAELAPAAGNENSEAAAVPESEQTDVTLVLDWLPNTNHTGFYIAQAKGYFEDEGLNVEIQQPPEDGALALLAAGRADFAVSAQESLATAITAETPLPVTTIATLIQHNTSGIISLKEKGITGPRQMEGYNYATWDTPIEKAILKHCIEAEGGDYGKIEMIPNTVTDVLTALQTNIDTVWVFYGWDGVATEVKGMETNFFYFSDIVPELDFFTPILVSSDDYLKENSTTAQKFLRASARGFEYAIEHPEEAAEILCTAAPEIDMELATASQLYLADKYKAEVGQWGYIDPARWDAFSAWMFENGIIAKEIPAGYGYTNDYLK